MYVTVGDVTIAVGGNAPNEANDESGGNGSLDDEREEDTVDPGAESLELKLVLLCGLSGAEVPELRGGMTPNGRPTCPLGKAPAEPGRKFDLQYKECTLVSRSQVYEPKDLTSKC